MSIWVVGLELKGSVIGGNGSVKVALLLKSNAQVGVSLWIVGFELESTVVGGNGSV